MIIEIRERVEVIFDECSTTSKKLMMMTTRTEVTQGTNERPCHLLKRSQKACSLLILHQTAATPLFFLERFLP